MKNKGVIIYQVACLLLIIVVVVLIVRDDRKENKDVMPEITVKEAALSVIHNRKSVRSFIPDKKISQEDINTIIKAGMAAPSGRDARPWEIIVVDDRQLLDAMGEKLPYAKMLAQSPQAIIVCGDSTESFYWYVDCSAVTQNILLAVEALGLGAVWTATFPYQDRMEVVMENIDLPENVLPLCIIPMGYPEGDHFPKDKYDETKIHYNRWNK